MSLVPGPVDSTLKLGVAPLESGLGESAVSTFPGSWGGATTFDGFSPTVTAPPDAFYGLNASRNSAADDTYSSALTNYPRIITAMQLLEEESDNDSVFCGPPSEPGDSGQSEIRHLKNHGVHIPEEVKPGNRLRETARLNREAREAARGTRDSRESREAREARREARESRESRGEPRSEREPREARGPRDPQEAREPKRQSAEDQEVREPGEKPVRHRPQPLIAPRGEIDDDNQKFICVFQIGLEDDEEFCLVKRILGKAGNNMRRIAEECSAKVRLRGIGSGFLEGSDGKEANMPLQLNVSCTDFDSYQGAVDRVSTLLKDLYKHYRRYARSRGMEVPDVKVNLEEVRRDDLAMDLLSQKAQRSPSQRERDRRQREKERQLQREREREKEREKEDRAKAEGDDKGNEPPRGSSQRKRSRERLEKDPKTEEDPKPVAKAKAPPLPTVLPGGLPVPTTPAGRRLAAKAGGAEAAAIVSAVARQQEREERDRLRKERDDQRERERDERERKKREAAQRAADLASRAGRAGIRGKPKGGSAGGAASADTADAGGKGSSKGKDGKGKISVPAKAPPPPPPGPPPADALEVMQAVPSASKDWSGWGSTGGMKSDWPDTRPKPKSSSKRK